MGCAESDITSHATFWKNIKVGRSTRLSGWGGEWTRCWDNGESFPASIHVGTFPVSLYLWSNSIPDVRC